MSKISVESVLTLIARCLSPSSHGIQPTYQIGDNHYRFLSKGEEFSVTDSAGEEHFFEALQSGIFAQYTKVSPNQLTAPHWLFLLPASADNISTFFTPILVKMDEKTLHLTSVSLASQRVLLSINQERRARRAAVAA